MPYSAPDWLNAEDVAREAALVTALRDVVLAAREVLEVLATDADTRGWRWRVDAVQAEAVENAARLRVLAEAIRVRRAPPVVEERSA